MATGPRRRADVARGSTAPLRRGAEATRGAQVALTRGRSHTDGPRRRPCGAPRGKWVRMWRAHGLVGPGK